MKTAVAIEMLHELDVSLAHGLDCTKFTRSAIGCTCGGQTARISLVIEDFLSSELLDDKHDIKILYEKV